MDDMINRHDSIAEKISSRMVVRLRTSLKKNGAARLPTVPMTYSRMTKKDGPIKNREKRIKEMDEVIKKDLE